MALPYGFFPDPVDERPLEFQNPTIRQFYNNVKSNFHETFVLLAKKRTPINLVLASILDLVLSVPRVFAMVVPVEAFIDALDQQLAADLSALSQADLKECLPALQSAAFVGVVTFPIATLSAMEHMPNKEPTENEQKETTETKGEKKEEKKGENKEEKKGENKEDKQGGYNFQVVQQVTNLETSVAQTFYRIAAPSSRFWKVGLDGAAMLATVINLTIDTPKIITSLDNTLDVVACPIQKTMDALPPLSEISVFKSIAALGTSTALLSVSNAQSAYRKLAGPDPGFSRGLAALILACMYGPLEAFINVVRFARGVEN